MSLKKTVRAPDSLIDRLNPFIRKEYDMILYIDILIVPNFGMQIAPPTSRPQ